jgi:ribose-phosphate pyrophosphokinase
MTYMLTAPMQCCLVQQLKEYKSSIETLVVTDTIPLRDAAKECAKIKVLSVSELLGKSIRCINSEDSVSSLFV